MDRLLGHANSGDTERHIKNDLLLFLRSRAPFCAANGKACATVNYVIFLSRHCLAACAAHFASVRRKTTKWLVNCWFHCTRGVCCSSPVCHQIEGKRFLSSFAVFRQQFVNFPPAVRTLAMMARCNHHLAYWWRAIIAILLRQLVASEPKWLGKCHIRHGCNLQRGKAADGNLGADDNNGVQCAMCANVPDLRRSSRRAGYRGRLERGLSEITRHTRDASRHVALIGFSHIS